MQEKGELTDPPIPVSKIPTAFSAPLRPLEAPKRLRWAATNRPQIPARLKKINSPSLIRRAGTHPVA
jgi:hypothetical protein